MSLGFMKVLLLWVDVNYDFWFCRSMDKRSLRQYPVTREIIVETELSCKTERV
jgi:hypothetical protein